MDTKNRETQKKPKGARLSLWRRLKLRDLFRGERTEPGRRRGTPQRKVRWGRARQLQEARDKRVRRDRAKRAMTKVLQRQRRSRGQDHRRG